MKEGGREEREGGREGGREERGKRWREESSQRGAAAFVLRVDRRGRARNKYASEGGG